jgi:hypothetical protein
MFIDEGSKGFLFERNVIYNGQPPRCLSFVAEMEAMPEMDVSATAHQWSDVEKAEFADG